MYGGFSLPEGRSYETVYTLSVPAFQWINATSVSDRTNTEGKGDGIIGRDHHSCQVHNGAQLVVVGGALRTDTGPLPDGECSQAFAPLRALDLSTYTWRTSFDPNITYQVPPVIYGVIGGK